MYRDAYKCRQELCGDIPPTAVNIGISHDAGYKYYAAWTHTELIIPVEGVLRVDNIYSLNVIMR